MSSWETWTALLTKPAPERSTPEATIVRAYILAMELEGGGLSGFLYNVSPAEGEPEAWHELRATADALDALELPGPAERLRTIATRFERAGPSGTTWDDRIQRAGPEGWLDGDAAAIEPSADAILAALERYTRATMGT